MSEWFSFLPMLLGHSRRSVATMEARMRLRELVFALVGLGTLAVFVEIAEEVARKEATVFDLRVSLGVHGLASPALDLLMRAFTLVGSAPVLLAVALALVAWCLHQGSRRGAAALAGVVVVEQILNTVLKLVFHRPRPSLWAAETLHSYSFPSGHAMAAVAIWGMIAVVLARLRSGPRWPAAIFAAPLALMIGVSRVYLGFHWPTDVLAGFAAGSFLLALGIYVLDS